MANKVMMNGVPESMSSPCGANCSYITTFDGPYFQCNSTSENITQSVSDATIYEGLWVTPPPLPGPSALFFPGYPNSRFTTSTSSLIPACYYDDDPENDHFMNFTECNITVAAIPDALCTTDDAWRDNLGATNGSLIEYSKLTKESSRTPLDD